MKKKEFGKTIEIYIAETKENDKQILEKLEYIMNFITNERSDLAEPIILDLIFYYKKKVIGDEK